MKRFAHSPFPACRYAFVLCDLDHFKQLNDRYGHESGDMALRAFADILRRVLP